MEYVTSAGLAEALGEGGLVLVVIDNLAMKRVEVASHESPVVGWRKRTRATVVARVTMGATVKWTIAVVSVDVVAVGAAAAPQNVILVDHLTRGFDIEVRNGGVQIMCSRSMTHDGIVCQVLVDLRVVQAPKGVTLDAGSGASKILIAKQNSVVERGTRRIRIGQIWELSDIGNLLWAAQEQGVVVGGWVGHSLGTSVLDRLAGDHGDHDREIHRTMRLPFVAGLIIIIANTTGDRGGLFEVVQLGS